MALPAVVPALAVLAGVAAGVWFEGGPGPGAVPAIWLLWALAAACLAQHALRLYVAAALAGFTLCGWALGAHSAGVAAAPPLRALLADRLGGGDADDSGDPVWLTGVLAQDVLPERDALRLVLDVEGVEVGRVQYACRGRVLLSVGGNLRPDVTVRWRQGRRLRLPALLRRPAHYRDPGVGDAETALLRRGVALVGSVKSPMLVDLLGGGSVLGEAGVRLRDRARQALEQDVGRHDPRSAAIARAVLLGDRAGLDRETSERLQQAGTYHVIAISGGNIAILTVLLMWGFRAIRLPSPLAEAAAGTILLAYAGLVGGGASVVRATLMATTYLAARAIDLRSPPSNAIAVAGGLVLAVAPLSVFDPGAWLTFGATLAILLGVGSVLPRLGLRSRWSRAAAGLFLASLSAELALFPVSAFAFSRVSVAGLAVNFAAVPLMSLVQVGGIVTLAAGAVHGRLGAVGGLVTHLAAWALVESARFVDVVPWTTWRLPAPGWPALVAYYAGWGVLWSRWLRHTHSGGRMDLRPRYRAGRAPAWAAAALTVASAMWMLTAPHGGRVAPGRLRVTWMDVGQGDAALVELPGGRTLLLDAGGAGGSSFDIGRRVIEPVAWARGVRRLDFLVITHPDADHLNGGAMLARDFTPAEVWEGVAVTSSELRTDLLREAASAGAAWRTVQRGDRIAIGGAHLTVWHPPPADWERQRVRNDDSTVVEIRYGDVSVLMAGDIEAAAESDLAPLIGAAPMRVVQAPHHGSSSSSTEVWLNAIEPDVVVISAGRGNRYGHPHAAVLARVSARRLPVFRTDRDGAVTLETDGRTLRMTAFSGRSLVAGSGTAVPRVR